VVLVGIDRLGQRFQRRGCVRRAVRAVLIMVGFVLARELVAQDVGAQQAAWSVATVAFAVGQALGAWGLSALFARTESYAPLFALGAGFLLAALALDLARAR